MAVMMVQHKEASLVGFSRRHDQPGQLLSLVVDFLMSASKVDRAW